MILVLAEAVKSIKIAVALTDKKSVGKPTDLLF